MAETALTQGADAATPAASSAPPPAPVQGSADDARAWLPQEFREHAAFRDFKDVAGLAKSYQHAASMVGLDKGKVLRLPSGEDAAEWGPVFDALGRPAKPEEYGLKAPAAAEGIPEEVLAAFAAEAHEAGFSKKQAERAIEFYGKTLAGMQEKAAAAMEAQRVETETALKAEWGAAFDDNMHAARRLLREKADPALLGELEATGLGNSPRLIKLLSALAAANFEPSELKGGGDGNMSRALTPSDARGQIAARQADPEFTKRYFDADAPGHKEAVAEMSRLWSYAAPDNGEASE